VYPARWLYSGGNCFPKHFYEQVGELDSIGEEFDCAMALDAQAGVKHWVRNLDSQETASMWLQTRDGKFYPDFVAELLDGRLLIVEYKGHHLVSNDESKGKLEVGEVWEARSGGKALFLMAVKSDEQGRGVYDQIKAKIEAGRS
jgi:type III restriction enzyme